MSVRAKLKVQSITLMENAREVRLSPVTGADGKGCESWSKWTPSGSVVLNITNPEAFQQFEVGGTYFADFVLAGE